ncbi:CHAT domain-containing protein [Geodermatophilus obscurus]|uniref:40-residue YVTN family beta-propeller repeat protein n=1 Tax=Geodermatophilus obscurus (strain ATCC 25078 / DSM 43160 / JCM 3152 / CCUG 61914 / KCC A-0152 / KCTC 9177 / NBRC 13315 / NRRL B-3577 / G-20) TaxID=526225 RepID=D2SFS1_GEOOG|nr:CHAT domain-containing protein [Geodermatophilus obscurus]ADB74826.1 40-residue YVTN family beta-propeller repeat protein [Geodermatophilus obscurus DSM 43160]
MTERTYLDFDVLVEPASATSYRARVLHSPVGETRPVPVTVPFSDLELENFLLRIGRPRRYLVRSEDAPEATAVRDFGGRLFDAVFRDQVRSALTASLDQAEGRDCGLRVRLRLTDAPELADLPWEYLYDKDARRFLALSEWTPLVRYLDLPGRIRPLPVQPPLRVLVLVASPSDFPPLDVDAEWARLHEALGELQHDGRVRLERAPNGSMAELQRQLRRGQHHVFHYIGHGRYDSELGDGQLAMEGATGRAQPISGSDLGALLHDHRTLRLALLNSCEGARGGRTDPYSGTAQSLVYQGIPAVVAMQFEITDRAAIVFTRGFYEAVADGYPLDAAMAEARKAIRLQPNQVEWGTPVLYLRAPDGRIFDVAHPPGSAHKAPVGPVPPEVAPEAVRGVAPEPAPGVLPAPRPDPGQPPGTAQPLVAAPARQDVPVTTDDPAREDGGPTVGDRQRDLAEDATAPRRGPGERRRSGDQDVTAAGNPGPTTAPEPPRTRRAPAPRARPKARPPEREGATAVTPTAPRTSTRDSSADGTPASPSSRPPSSRPPSTPSPSTPPPSPPPSPPSGRVPVPARGPQPSPGYRWLLMAVVLLVAAAAGAVFVAIDRQRLSQQGDPAGTIASESTAPEPAAPTSSGPPPVSPSMPIPSAGAIIPVGETPGYAVASPSGAQLYVANRAARTITVVDTELDRVTGTIPVPVGPPQFVVFSADGRTAYLSLYDEGTRDGAFGVLDTRTWKMIETIPLDGKPWSPAVSRDGGRVFVPVEGPNTVVVIDAGAYEVLTEIPVPPLPHSVEFTLDGTRAYVADHTSNVVAVIDTTTDRVVREVPVDAGPHRVAVHPARPLVANVNYDADTVTVIDTSTDTVVTSIPVEAGPQDITWAPDGQFAYVTSVDADTLSVIAAGDWSTTARIPIGDAPTSVAVLPDGSRGYVTNLNDGTVRVLDLDG